MAGVTTSPWSRSHRVFAAALQRRVAVGVQVAVSEHLARTASRSESVSARRAAHSFAAAGFGRLEHAQVSGHGNRDRLVLVRNDAILDPDTLVAAPTPAGGTAFTSLDARTMHTDAARRLVATVLEAATQSRHIKHAVLTANDAAELAAALEVAPADLRSFRRRLNRTSQVREVRAAPTPDTADSSEQEPATRAR